MRKDVPHEMWSCLVRIIGAVCLDVMNISNGIRRRGSAAIHLGGCMAIVMCRVFALIGDVLLHCGAFVVLSMGCKSIIVRRNG